MNTYCRYIHKAKLYQVKKCQAGDAIVQQGTWTLPEIHAGVPGMGATDAWHAALVHIEEMKLEEESCSGAVADIAKFVDQIRRRLVYTIWEAVGMPEQIARAYRNYVEELHMYN